MAAPAEYDTATGPFQNSSAPQSSAGSTIEDPDMTDEDPQAGQESDFDEHSRSRNASEPLGPPSSPPPTSSPFHQDSPQPDGGLSNSRRSEQSLSVKNLLSGPSRRGSGSRRGAGKMKGKRAPAKGTLAWIQDGPNRDTEDEGSVQNDVYTRSADVDVRHTMTVATTVGTRRQANGTIGSVYSGNKIRHLKKEDGVPLWRKDIQFEFLKTVFEDKTPVFTRISDSKSGCDFADIYIDAMARSSKTSKILKDKLQSDKTAAISMAMVCLLVNVGRMNTTLNFFPEMRAQLRTYHSIPSLQAHQDPNAYKQLQDAPRLKSILKGASEDTEEPRTIEQIMHHPIPRTNPVNLIFVLSQYAPKISEQHFDAPRDFFDLVMRPTLSSRSRARAFLWLMWWYLESNFSKHDALNNPFGPGRMGEKKEGLPITVPTFEHLTEEQGNAENVDTPEEIRYGEEKQKERKRILEQDEADAKAAKHIKRNQPGLFSDDGEGSMSAYDSGHPGTGDHHDGYAEDDALEDIEPYPAHPGRGRYKRVKRTHDDVRSSPAPPGQGHPVLNQFVPENAVMSSNTQRRPRPLTQHQLAVEQNRKARVNYILEKKLREDQAEARTKRESRNFLITAARRIQNLPPLYDSEDEENSWGPGGLVPNPDEGDDIGDEAEHWASVIRKARRRLLRWKGAGEGPANGVALAQDGTGVQEGVISTSLSSDRLAPPRLVAEDSYDEDEFPLPTKLQGAGDSLARVKATGGQREGSLDELDKELLGDEDSESDADRDEDEDMEGDDESSDVEEDDSDVDMEDAEE